MDHPPIIEKLLNQENSLAQAEKSIIDLAQLCDVLLQNFIKCGKYSQVKKNTWHSSEDD
jgi:ribulose kinase